MGLDWATEAADEREVRRSSSMRKRDVVEAGMGAGVVAMTGEATERRRESSSLNRDVALVTGEAGAA